MGSDEDALVRRRRSLTVLGRIERRAGLYRLPGRSRYRMAGAHAVRPGREPLLDRLPTRLGAEATTAVTGWSRSDAVVFGKFDRPGTPRLRAFQTRRAGETALKVQPYRGEDEHGIGREIAARRRVAELAPHVSPGLRTHGMLHHAGGRLGYFVEDLVAGHHVPRWELHEIVAPLVGALADLYRAAGISSVPWSRVGASRQLERWRGFVDEHPEAEPLRDRVDALLRADLDVEVSLVHGDPVASNVVVREDGGVVLVDWEYAREHAIALDLTKPVQQAIEQQVAIDAVEHTFGGLVGTRRSSYTLTEQLALPQVQMLCWYEQQLHKARQARRVRRYREVQAQRVALLERLLDPSR